MLEQQASSAVYLYHPLTFLRNGLIARTDCFHGHLNLFMFSGSLPFRGLKPAIGATGSANGQDRGQYNGFCTSMNTDGVQNLDFFSTPMKMMYLS